MQSRSRSSTRMDRGTAGAGDLQAALLLTLVLLVASLAILLGVRLIGIQERG